MSKVIYWKCKKKGHCANKCPEGLHDRKDNDDGKDNNFATQGDKYKGDYDDELDEEDYNYLFNNIGYDRSTVSVDVSHTDHVFNNDNKKSRLPSMWILLDNQSTVNVF